MKIGELGKATGVDVETIRYYERTGLLPPARRQANGYRVYGDFHQKRLEFIRHCRSLDISLAEINQLLNFLDLPAAECADVDRLVDAQLIRVRDRINGLRALERQLIALRGCCVTPNTIAECGILRELVGEQ